MKIRLLSKIDHLKGNWYLWDAEREKEDGSIGG